LEADELDRLLKAPFVKKDSLIRRRDKAILELFFSTGLRVSELANLHIDQINAARDEFTVRGKGDKPRIVFLTPEAKSWMKQYLDLRLDTQPYLFVSHDRAREGRETVGPLTPRSIERMIQQYAKAVGITKRITPHTMRHTFATDLLLSGADIRSVQALLGHVSITTTQVYTHITNKQLKEIHHQFHGKTRKGKTKNS
jgi:site-specific recombinase XerD